MTRLVVKSSFCLHAIRIAIDDIEPKHAFTCWDKCLPLNHKEAEAAGYFKKKFKNLELNYRS